MEGASLGHLVSLDHLCKGEESGSHWAWPFCDPGWRAGRGRLLSTLPTRDSTASGLVGASRCSSCQWIRPMQAQMWSKDWGSLFPSPWPERIGFPLCLFVCFCSACACRRFWVLDLSCAQCGSTRKMKRRLKTSHHVVIARVLRFLAACPSPLLAVLLALVQLRVFHHRPRPDRSVSCM